MGFCCCAGEAAGDHHKAIRTPHAKFDSFPNTCTDVIPLIVFVAFLASIVYVACYGFVHGDADRVLVGTDSFGNTCGSKNDFYYEDFGITGADMTARRYLMPVYGKMLLKTAWICVRSCPVEAAEANQQFHEKTNYKYCSWFNKTQIMCVNESIYPSETVFSGRCLPRNLIGLAAESVEIITLDWIEDVVNEFYYARWEVARLCGLTILICLIAVLLMSYLASLMIYTVAFGLVVLSFAVAVLSWVGFASISVPNNTITSTLTNHSFEIVRTAVGSFSGPTVFGFAIAATVFAFVVAVILWCFLPRCLLVVDLFREAGRALRSIPCLFFQPFITGTIIVFLYCFWVIMAVLVFTSSPPKKKIFVIGEDETFEGITYTMSSVEKFLMCYLLISLIWMTEFVFACHRMIVASAVTIWYFNRDHFTFTYLIAIKNLVFYHIGSIALGSFIIVTVKIPRYILLYISSKSSKKEESILLGVCASAMKIIEEFLRVIHHNAYTIVALRGRNFFPAAKTAMKALMDKAVDFATVNVVGDGVLFVAKCIIAVSVTFLAFMDFNIRLKLQYWHVCSFMVGIFAYSIASCFFALVEMVIDTLFLAYAHDEQYVDDSGELSYYYPKFVALVDKATEQDWGGGKYSSRVRKPSEFRPADEQQDFAVPELYGHK